MIKEKYKLLGMAFLAIIIAFALLLVVLPLLIELIIN
jgi:hypothetical protein